MYILNLKKMNKIIEEILKNGIPVSMEYNKEKNKIVYIIEGFYKSGSINLEEKENEDVLIATARYDEQTIVESFKDLVSLNYDWWMYSKDKYDGWKSPESRWLPFLLEMGLVKQNVEHVVKYS